MITPELKQYIDAQSEAGITPEKLRETLLAAGWPEDQIAEGLNNISPKPAKKRSWLPLTILLILLGVGGWYIYQKSKDETGAEVATISKDQLITYSGSSEKKQFLELLLPGGWVNYPENSDNQVSYKVMMFATQSDKDLALKEISQNVESSAIPSIRGIMGSFASGTGSALGDHDKAIKIIKAIVPGFTGSTTVNTFKNGVYECGQGKSGSSMEMLCFVQFTAANNQMMFKLTSTSEHFEEDKESFDKVLQSLRLLL